MKKIKIILEKKAKTFKEQYVPGDEYRKSIDGIEYIQHTDPNLDHHKTLSADEMQEFTPFKLLSLFVVIKLRELGFVGGPNEYSGVAKHEIMAGPNRYKASEYEQFKAQIENDGNKGPIIEEILRLLENLPDETEEELAQKRQSDKEARERYQRIIVQPEREKRRADWEASIPGKIEKAIDKTIGEPLRENKLGLAKAAIQATPGAGQAAAAGTGAEIAKQAGGLASEKALARALVPYVGRGIAGVLGASLVGLLVPSELGDGSISGKITATLKKHFPEADSEALTAKIIMFNKINGRNALQFPDKRTIHSLAGTDMKDLQRQLEEKAKEIEPQGEPVAENIDSLDVDSTLSRPTREDLLNEPVAAYVIQRLEGAIQHLSGRIDKLEGEEEPVLASGSPDFE